jgi:hypothetical protein
MRIKDILWISVIALGAWVPRAYAQVPLPSQTLSAAQPGLAAARLFGQSMASNGQYLAVGAPFYSGASGGTSPGVVLIYQRSGNTWNFLSSVQAPTPANGDGFGAHVIFSGSQLLVGAPYSTVNGSIQRGAVHAYSIVAGIYTHTETINPGVAAAPGDWYGFSLAADAGWLAIGLPLHSNTDSGQVQLFRYDSDLERWVYHSFFNGTSNAARHGIRVLVRGDRLLVGATEEPATSSTRGWAYEYRRTGAGATASWAQVQRFRQIGGLSSVFGSAFALSPSGDTLMVGAPYEVNGTQTGAVFAFTRDGNGEWSQSARLNPPQTNVAENFGASIVFSGEREVIIGDTREGFPQPLGAAHLYRRASASVWNPAAAWRRGTGNPQDFMGVSLLAVGDQLLIGASGIDNGASADEGRVFVYDGALALFRDGFD